MLTPRRLYVYAVSAITLQAVTQALIALLRHLIISGLDPQRYAIAFEIAVIVIGLAIFVPHWLWALRIARKEAEERESVVRRLYLYGMQAAFLGPFVNSAFSIAARVSAEVADRAAARSLYPDLPAGEFVLYHLVGAILLALIWYYHQRLIAEESSAATEVEGPATVRRLYVLSYSAVGLTMTTIAIVNLLTWILFQIGAHNGAPTNGAILEIGRLIVGVPLWLFFWGWAERLLAGPVDEERVSALHKFYLFAVVSLAALISVTAASILVASLFRNLLSVGSGAQADSNLAIALIVAMAMLWIYHGLVLQEQTRRAPESPSQASVRRLYTYIVAGIGLSSALVGLGELISVLIPSLEQSATGPALKQQLAWAAAALIAGLPVWAWPWRGAQLRAADKGAVGDSERNSLARKVYLYFFLLVATLVFLGFAVSLLSDFLGVLLGDPGPGISELGHSIGYGLLALATWLYHADTLRADRRLGFGELGAGPKKKRVAVIDLGDGSLGAAVSAELKRQITGLRVDSIHLGAAMRQTRATAIGKQAIPKADLIIGPWTMTGGISAAGSGAVKPEIARAIARSTASKLLIPTRAEGYEWAGVDRWKQPAIVRQVVSAALQILRGEEVRPSRQLGVGAIIGIVLTGLVLLLILLGPLMSFLLY